MNMPAASAGGFINLIRFILQHPDELLALLQNMLTVMNTAGQGMEAAGNGAISASRFFTGGPGIPVSTDDAMEAAADAIEAAKSQIRQAANLIEDAATAIGDIKVPTVTPTFTTIGMGSASWRVVNGLTVGDATLFGGVEDALKDGADHMSDFGDDLQGAATALRSVGSRLNSAGEDLNEMGVALRDAGQGLQELTDES